MAGQSTSMETIIQLWTKDGHSHKVSIPLVPGSMDLEQLVVPFRVLFEKIISLDIKGKNISCKEGCSACCQQLIPLSIPEVFYLYRVIDSLQPDLKKRVKKRFARNKNTLNKAGLLADLKHPGKVRTMDQQYFELGLPCPFLESGRCSIYESRPFVCREYYVTSPPALCKTPYDSPLEKLETGYKIGALLTAFSARMLNLAKTPVPLIILQDWTEMFVACAIKKYDSAWVFEQLLKALTELRPETGSIVKISIAGGEKE